MTDISGFGIPLFTVFDNIIIKLQKLRKHNIFVAKAWRYYTILCIAAFIVSKVILALILILKYTLSRAYIIVYAFSIIRKIIKNCNILLFNMVY